MDNSKKTRNKLETFVFVFVAFVICIYDNCYFMWDSYNNSFVSTMFKMAQHFAGVLLLLYAYISNKGLKISRRGYVILFFSILLFLHVNLLGSQYLFASILLCVDVTIGVIAILSLQVQQRLRLFRIVIVVFCIITLPGLLYYILCLLGCNMNYSILLSDHPGKVSRGMYYWHKTFGLILVDPAKINRYTGLFDEPGMIGTTAAILFAAGYKRINIKWLLLLLVEGTLSFSMAFYGLIIIFFTVRILLESPVKMICMVGILVCAIIAFRNITFESKELTSIQNRFKPNTTLSVKTNRYSTFFEKEYNMFWEKGGYPLYMGIGGFGSYAKNPSMAGANTYKCLIYDLGIVGCFIFLSFFASICIIKNKVLIGAIPFLSVFLVSLYQRAYVYKFSTVAIFILAITMIYYECTMDKRLSLNT